MTFAVEQVEWRAEPRWYFGERQPVAPLQPGDKVVVAVDDDWSLQEGARATVGVSTIPFADVAGYVHVALGVDPLTKALPPTDGADGDLGARSMQQYVRAAAELRGVSLAADSAREPQTELVVELIEASRLWLDEQNTAVDPKAQAAPPGGLVAEVNRALGRGADVATGNDQLVSVPADLRQLPMLASDGAALSDALGVELVPARGAVFDETGRYTFFALRFEGVGVLGPWSTDPDLSYGRLYGLAPTSGAVELLGWVDADPQPTNAISIGGFSVPDGWDPSSDVLDITVEANRSIVVEVVDSVALTVKIDQLLAKRTR